MLLAKKTAPSLYDVANAALETMKHEIKAFRVRRRAVVKEPGPRTKSLWES
jgi:hypothetical protein